MEIVCIFGGICVLVIAALSPILPHAKAKSVMKQAYQIHQACFAYAQGNDQAFPDGNTANEVFRKLFERGLIDDELLFWIASSTKPNGIISDSQGNFNKALEPGECCFYFVRPSKTKEDDSGRPLIFARVGGADGKVYDIVVARYGNANVQSPGDPTLTIAQSIAKQFGIDPKDILEPEGPLPRAWELPAPPQPAWQAFLFSPITLAVFMLIAAIYFHRRRKGSRPFISAPLAVVH
jgi:hypothetical protein